MERQKSREEREKERERNKVEDSNRSLILILKIDTLDENQIPFPHSGKTVSLSECLILESDIRHLKVSREEVNHALS